MSLSLTRFVLSRNVAFLICNKIHKNCDPVCSAGRATMTGKQYLKTIFKQILLAENIAILQVSFIDILERIKQGH